MAKKNNNRNNNNNKNNSGGGSSTNQQIQKALSNAGNTVSYKEASSVAAKLGVSVDRVYNQTAKTGQAAKAGSAAANAGYTPGSNLKVANPITSGYTTQAYNNFKAQQDAYYASQNNPNAGGDGYVEPEFDWDAWNMQMMEQQAAVWASMDAMNAQFLQQQEAWQQQQAESQKQNGFTFQNRSNFGSMGGAQDQAKVKRKKKRSTTAAGSGTKLSIGGSGGSGNGVSMGGAGGGKTLGIS